jgi:hypothetical protein
MVTETKQAEAWTEQDKEDYRKYLEAVHELRRNEQEQALRKSLEAGK